MNIIGIDVHKEKCEISRINREGREVDHVILDTSLHKLIYYVNQVKSKTKNKVHVVFEEGELAGWLYRGLKPHVEKVVSSDPKKNDLIYNYGDKTDVIDPLKLAQLYRGDFINPVYHTDDKERAKFKDMVYTYHKITKDVARNKNRLKSLYRRNGIMVKGDKIYNSKNRAEYLTKIDNKECAKLHFEMLKYVSDKKDRLKNRIKKKSKKYSVIKRLKTIPGFGDITASTIFIIIDNPYRFSKKSKLWTYANIGRRRAQSGDKEKNKKQNTGNRLLKRMIGNVFASAMKGDNKFSRKYMELLSVKGKDTRIARRVVYRKILTTAWSIWKNGSKYNDDY
ncbi:MAG: transposase [Candidatus Marinimicrobia bacterium]|nr:transposase [Candidatus Neomarinimicrobiota bacterium]